MQNKQRTPLLSTSLDWIVLEIFILFCATVVYTVIILVDESKNTSQTGLETFKTTVKEVVPFFQFALIFIIGIFEIGGEVMLRYTQKMQQARNEGRIEGIAEGEAKGKNEIYQQWYADWERRKQAAAEKGIPFDDPPPPNPQNGNQSE